MKNELKFNSQICTTYKQSKRLLEMGLKPETADMSIITNAVDYDGIKYSLTPYSETNHPKIFGVIPAWSLHRLIEILDSPLIEFNVLSYNPYEEIIYLISECIENGYISKEYLKQ